MCKRWRRAQLSGDLDKNLILFVTLCSSLWGLSLQVNHGSSSCWRSSLLSPSFLHLHLPRVKTHSATVCADGCLHVCLSSEYFFHVWVQWTMVFFFCIAHWYKWPGVNESRGASVQISKEDWEGLNTCRYDSTVWKLVGGGNTNIGLRWHQRGFSFVHFSQSFWSR